MILVDTNLLVYAHIDSLPQHKAAYAWMDEKLNAVPAMGLPWASLLGFVRLVSNRRILEHPVPMAYAWKQVEDWLACSNVWIPGPTERHREILGPLIVKSAQGANLVPDAHLAALAIEHGLTLCSADGDFARFPGLRWENPLA
ncbi:MAG: type II toxin-antitoxin system VapC family toxin [Acidobacteria bacterium]|nr:type II toxin-antitoxin system VapC family toxin [Acidobacteriota bacterium]